MSILFSFFYYCFHNHFRIPSDLRTAAFFLVLAQIKAIEAYLVAYPDPAGPSLHATESRSALALATPADAASSSSSSFFSLFTSNNFTSSLLSKDYSFPAKHSSDSANAWAITSQSAALPLSSSVGRSPQPALPLSADAPFANAHAVPSTADARSAATASTSLPLSPLPAVSSFGTASVWLSASSERVLAQLDALQLRDELTDLMSEVRTRERCIMISTAL